MEKWVLNRSRDAISADLQPKYVVQYLLKKGIVTDGQLMTILAEENEEEQTKILLEVIENGGSKAYEVFKRCLEGGSGSEGSYDWLAKGMRANEEEWDVECAKSNSVMTILTRGGVPTLPSNFVVRSCLEKEIGTKLEELFQVRNGGGFVVLHGMPGGGKTMMAASAVRNESLLRSFYRQGVFWLKMGKNIYDDSLLNKMHTLCEKIDPSYRNCLPVDLDMASDRLRTLFSSEEHRDSLLVLDDVWHDFVIGYFDFGCRVLVTTRDKGIVAVVTSRVFYVEMKLGFTRKESQQFYANSLAVRTDELPISASEIWSETKGCPLVAAIVIASVKQHPNKVYEAFRRCLDKLRNNTLISVRKRSHYEYPCIAQAIQMSMESLEEMTENYYDLVIFPQDVYFSEQVLAVLWDVDVLDVEETMNAFIEKSLAVKVPNGRHTNYYYVHDLYLQYLKSSLVNTLPGRHKQLIRRYLQICGGQYENLPFDGYILFFLGYHLQAAQMYEEFPIVFLDLKFIGNKMKATGPADVLGDYDRYREHISCDKKHLKKISDFENFVKSTAHLFSSDTNYDIVQLALLEPAESEVYCQAKKLCFERSNSVFYEWCNKKKITSSCCLSTRHHKCEVNAACFTSDGRYVISAGDDGTVKIWDSNNGNERLHLEGHKRKISCCASTYSRDQHKEVIVTGSSDCTVRVWHIGSDDFKNCERVRCIDTSFHIFSNHTSKVVSCCLAKSAEKAASVSVDGVIKIWSVVTGLEFASWEAHRQSFNFCSCDFSSDGTRLVSAAASFICMWNVDKELPEWEFEDRDRVFTCCRFTPDGSKVIATVNYQLTVFSTDSGAKKFTLLERTKIPLLGCSVSSDGELVAASTTNCCVIVWTLNDRSIVDIFRGHSGWVSSVSFSNEDGIAKEANYVGDEDVEHTHRLVSTHSGGTVMIWKVNRKLQESGDILRDVFSAQFDSNGNAVTAVVDVNNKIQVRKGINQNLFAFENGSSINSLCIRCCALSYDFGRVVYGSTNGSVKIFTVQTSVTVTLKRRSNCEVSCCVFNNANDIAAGYSDGAIDIFSKGVVFTFSGHLSSITKIQFFDNDTRLLSGSFDQTLRVWDLASRRQLAVCCGHDGSIITCDVSQDSCILLSASVDKTLMLWDSKSGVKEAVLKGHNDIIRSCRFSSKYELIASGDDSGFIIIWRYKISQLSEVGEDMSTKIAIECLSMVTTSKSWVYDLLFSNDSTQLVVCSNGIQLWSTSDLVDKDSNPSALQIIPIVGTGLRISASPTFESFVTADAGILYYFKKVKLRKS